ncbi:putative methyltransferase-like protein [Emericellopsis cladophorae]|uniref:Methyltransferase-like protein n=1 Tax=Emericellopsis cladophorae TaxID=2686198 RepID=A0A9P9Y7L2_9HYPO|nr:putative methyltransferase-like protein [Emericellopsis cladophorae]KAI6785004.1 putative methyltransferase-like protein [Emericellopsis cladophorae]
MAHAHADHEQGHSHHEADDIGGRNKAHFDKLSVDLWNIPWIKALGGQITQELKKDAETGSLNTKPSSESTRTYRMLDYACGNGVISRALALCFDDIQGLDISPEMVDQYNKLAETSGLSDRMRATVGDLINGSDQLNALEYSGFDLIVMSMALHHVEDPVLMIRRLSERLAKGGVLLIIDWVSPAESGCRAFMGMHDHPTSHIVSRMGFERRELDAWFADAGLQSFTWRWAADRSSAPVEHGGDKQMFFARATRPL